MGFFNSYTKEGKGVGKDEVRPIRPLYFFEILFRKISKFFPLNMLYVLLTIPVWVILYLTITVVFQGLDANPEMFNGQIVYEAFYSFSLFFTLFSVLTGPATAGITYVFKSFATETPSFVYADFFENYKKNFKQSFLLMFLTGIFMISCSLTLYRPELAFLRIPSLIFFTLLIFVNFYAFSIMIMFKMKFIDILKNSFIFALAKLPLNIFLLAIIGIISYFAVAYTVLGVILTAVFLYAFCGFLITFSVYPTIEKYMLEPAAEKDNINEKDFND